MSSTPILLHADTERSADLFYSVPLNIGDPFLYAEVDSRKVAVIGVLERDRILSLDLGIEVLDPVEFGVDDLLKKGLNPLDISREVALRACNKLGIKEAAVPPTFPLAYADHLRAGGVELTVDSALFNDRRRVKTESQLTGIRRAQAAADAAMAIAAMLILELPPGLTSDQVRDAMKEECRKHDAELTDEAIVAHGPQSASGHESGFGEIKAGEPVVVDIWPRDRRSRCFADMTRTFVAGGVEPPSQLLEFWKLCRESLDAVMPEIRAGASARELFDRSCEPFESAGYPTRRTKKTGEILDRGYYHSLGHGVGLEVHEVPGLGMSTDVLVAGEVITVEPGCYEPGFGGCRLEDLVLVTEDGAEIITSFPYGLKMS